MAIFAIGYGLIVAFVVLAVPRLSSTSGQLNPEVAARARTANMVMFPPCGLSVLAGVLMAATRRRWCVIGCALAGTAVSVAALVLLAVGTGGVRLNLTTAVLVAVPILLFSRGVMALKAFVEPPPLPGQQHYS